MQIEKRRLKKPSLFDFLHESAGGRAAPMALPKVRGIFSHVREYPPWTPKRTQGALPLDPAIASEQLEELQCLPNQVPALFYI